MTAARWAAVAMLAVTFAVIGIFVWALIRPPAPPAEAAAGTPVEAEKRVDGPTGAWRLAVQALPRNDRTVAVTVSARHLDGGALASGAAPRATLRMLDMAMEDERVALTPDGPGSWRGTARLSMAGRWSLRVEHAGGSLNVSFQAMSL